MSDNRFSFTVVLGLFLLVLGIFAALKLSRSLIDAWNDAGSALEFAVRVMWSNSPSAWISALILLGLGNLLAVLISPWLSHRLAQHRAHTGGDSKSALPRRLRFIVSGADPGCIRSNITQTSLSLSEGTIIQSSTPDVTYFRIKVENEDTSPVDNVSAHLLSVERNGVTVFSGESYRLPLAAHGDADASATRIAKGVPRYIDVLAAVGHHKLQLASVNFVNPLTDELKPPGEYVFRVVVTWPAGSIEIVPAITWTGDARTSIASWREAGADDPTPPPNISLVFRPEFPWVFDIEKARILPDVERPARFFAVRVVNENKNALLRGVRVELTDVERREGDKFVSRGFGTSARLRWSRDAVTGYEPRDISYLAVNLAEIISVDAHYNKVLIKQEHSWASDAHLFDVPGVYRLTVAAIPAEGEGKTIRLCLKWTGQWQETEMWTDEQATTSNSH